MTECNGHIPKLREWLIARAAHELGVPESQIDAAAKITTLGVDSLALITIAGELAELTNQELQAELLWQHDSIDALARYLEGTADGDSVQIPEGSSLSTLRHGDGRSPVVSVGFQNVATLLCESLPENVPVWWLPLDGLYQPPLVIRPVPEMAAAFADDVSSVAPPYPLSLVGYSFGGLIALDLAYQLERRGIDVRLLLLEPARFPRSEPENWRGMIRRHHRTLGSLNWRERVSYAWDRLATIRWRRQFKRIRSTLVDRINTGEVVSPEEKWQVYQKEIVKILWGYQPPRYPGSAVLAGRPEWLLKHTPVWRELVTGELTQVPLPQTEIHEKIVEVEAAAPWLEVMRAWIEDAPATSRRDEDPRSLQLRRTQAVADATGLSAG